eukprot:627719_1
MKSGSDTNDARNPPAASTPNQNANGSTASSTAELSGPFRALVAAPKITAKSGRPAPFTIAANAPTTRRDRSYPFEKRNSEKNETAESADFSTVSAQFGSTSSVDAIQYRDVSTIDEESSGFFPNGSD